MGRSRLDARVVVVTGASRGIGLAVARACIAEGARVAMVSRNAARLADAAGMLEAGERVECIAADLGRSDAPTDVVLRTLGRFGRLDALVNNAGIAGQVDAWATDTDQWDAVQTLNVRAAFFLARASYDAMRSSGRSTGSIVNLSSVAGQIGGVATGPAYVAAKAALIGLTRSLARHFAPAGVRVNAIAPADIDTDMTAGWSAELRARLVAMTPLGRFGTAAEVASAVTFLLSDEASFVTGQTINVNGGIYMG